MRPFLIYAAAALVALPAWSESIHLVCTGSVLYPRAAISSRSSSELEEGPLELPATASVVLEEEKTLHLELLGNQFSGTYDITDITATMINFFGRSGRYGSLEGRRGEIDRNSGRMRLYLHSTDQFEAADIVALVNVDCQRKAPVL